jgi:hypothetical protein
MLRVFDRPVKYTLNAILVKPATPSSLTATVWLKDAGSAGKGTPAVRYLGPQIDGGARGHKGMEAALIQAGLMYAGQFAVPAAGAQLDANGNVRRTQIVQILSQLKVQRTAGYESRRSDSAASKRALARQGVTYFALRQARRGLKAGIYRKTGTHGSDVLPVFIFVSKAQYQKRFNFYEVGDGTALERFPINFASGMEKAIARTRLR